jgi:AraC-like DNA-binding protein
MWNEQEVLSVSMPLSFSPIAHTSSAQETEVLFGDQLVSSRIRKARDTRDFGVSMNGVAIGSCVVSAIHHKTDYDIDCGDIDVDDAIIFGYGSGAPSSTYLRGKGFNLNEHGLIVTRHSDVTHRRRGDSYEFVIKCSKAGVMSRLQSSLDRHVSRNLVFEETIKMNSEVGEHARRTLDYVISSLDSNRKILDSPLTAASLEDMLIGVVLSLPHNHSEELSRPGMPTAAPAVVASAEAYMEGHADLPITMQDVLEHVACSRNTLFKNFRKFRGYTPWEFLTTRRLELAHNRLLEPLPHDTVTSIAMELGFTHMGRFSQIYRKRYGKRPSETLNGARH